MKNLSYQVFSSFSQKFKNKYVCRFGLKLSAICQFPHKRQSEKTRKNWDTIGILFLSGFAFLSLYPPVLFSNPYRDQNQTETPDYTCQVNSDCLDTLNNVLLNKESDRGIYKYCEITLDNTKLCCSDPSQCQEPWAEDFAQDLRENSLKIAQSFGEDLLSCQLNRLSNLINSLFKIQNAVCKEGLRNCPLDCEKKLREATKFFRQCFSIPNSLSIQEVLEKTKSHPPAEQACYQKMRDTAEKYREQSLNGKAVFRENLKAEDIVNCEEIKKVQTQAGLNNFALSVCHQAQIQKQKEDENKFETEEAAVEPTPQGVKANPLLPSGLEQNPLAHGAQNVRLPEGGIIPDSSEEKSGKERGLPKQRASSGRLSPLAVSLGHRYGGVVNTPKTGSGSKKDLAPSRLNRLNRNPIRRAPSPPQTFSERVFKRVNKIAKGTLYNSH